MIRNETQRKCVFLKCVGIATLALLMLVSTASADLWVYDMKGSSYPNPSIEGQDVTYTINVTYSDTETGEIFPANVGRCGWFHPLAGTNELLVNGSASITRSNVLPGDYNIEIICWGFTNPSMDVYESMNHRVLPYVQDWQITSDNRNPATFTATFDFAETDDPTFIHPEVRYCIDAYNIDDDSTCGGIEAFVPENGIVTWTTPELQTGTYKVYAGYYVESVGGGSHEELFMTYYVDGEKTEIPEFPSVALPVIAVLGLVAIIGRKKE